MAASQAQAERAKLKRHLGALLHKNALLKRRHPCSLVCELFLAIGSTGLLAFARWLTRDVKAFEIPAQTHVDGTMPVRLPECAEYVAECAVRLVEDEAHNPLCVKGVTFGCHSHGGTPGVWVSMGCKGTFDTGPGTQRITCASDRLGRMHKCRAVETEDGRCEVAESARRDCGWMGVTQDQCESRGCCYQELWGRDGPWCYHRRGRRPTAVPVPRLPPRAWKGRKLQGLASSPVSMMSLLRNTGQSDMRRLSAQFAIAPADGGGREFLQFLRETGHPWADSARLYASAKAVQSHMTASDYPARDLHKNTSAMLCGAVIFEAPPSASEVRYTLRFNSTLGFDPNLPALAGLLKATKVKTNSLVDSPSEHPSGHLNTAGMTWYTQSGFLSMQRTVDAFLSDAAPGRAGNRSGGVAAGGGAGGAGGGFGFRNSLLGEDGRLHAVVPFPTAKWQRDIFAMLMPSLLANFLLISLAYSVNRMITAVVHEREARLRDGMRMMGMHPVAFYLSWIITYFLVYLFVCSGVVLCLTLGNVLAHTSPTLLFAWLLLFAAASISYALVISTFFTKAKTAATVGSLAFFASSYFVHLANPTSSLRFLRLISLLPPVCFELAAKVLAEMESQGVGISWANMSIKSSTFGTFSLLDGCLMLAFDAVLFLLLFLYLDQVAPREVGLQRPWFFPLQPSFWRGLCCCDRIVVGGEAGAANAAVHQQPRDPEAPECSALVERELGEAVATMSRSGQTVELRGLSKTFGHFRAVKGLDLVMLQGEIFALLGHNGAGKTTTLAMLCGLMPPTSGSCIIFNQNLEQEPAEVQKLLGVCPQHDVLWEELTCEEHLKLFAGFKGVPQAEVSKEVTGMLQRVGLQAVSAATTQAGRLSGGMKRKLSLGIAFLGGSRLVVLDEPTSGLDPYSRRMVWELLRAMKHGRVTVLSTHYMDEADILGDRIAILHEGSLRCCGSPQFLKRAYDCGYNVTFVKRAGCETDKVMEAVCSHMPELASEVVPLSDSANELILQFPFAAARHFPKVLGSLERQLGDLSLESYGVSVTTLEEVFLKVASGEKVERSTQKAEEEVPSDEAKDEYMELQELPATAGPQTQAREVGRSLAGHASQGVGAELPRGRGPFRQLAGAAQRFAAHMRALLLKRCRYGLRDRRGFICQLCLPSGTLILLLTLMSAKLFRSMPPLELNVASYNENCEGFPQNMVDFTHLYSVDPDAARELLEPGKPFWNGDIRGFQPEPADEWATFEEETVTSAVPGLLHNVLRPAIREVMLTKSLPDLSAIPELLKGLPGLKVKKWRKLSSSAAGSGEQRPSWEKLIERRILQVGVELWALISRAGHATDVSRSQFGDLLGNDLPIDSLAGMAARMSDLRRPRPSPPASAEEAPPPPPPPPPPSPGSAAAGAGAAAGGRRLLKFAKFPRQPEGGGFDERDGSGQSCEDASQSEMMLWEMMDTGRDGRLSKDELKKELQRVMPKAGLQNMLRAAANATKADPQAEEEIDSLVVEAIFLTLDKDRDGFVSEGEFCAAGALARQEANRLLDLALTFSDQILNSTSSCPRYGAYYVLRAARTKESPAWDAGSDAVIFVNTTSAHAAPAYQAALTNARLARLKMGKKVSVSVHPFPQTPNEQQNLEKVAVFLLAIYITFCLSFIPAGIAHFVVKERESGAQQLQILSGASHLTFWLSNLIYDVALYTVPALCVPAALSQFGFNMILAGECGSALAVVLALFGPAVAGFSYLASFFFKDHSKASNAILTFCLVGASVLSTVLFILSIINYNPAYAYPTACDIPTEGYPEGNCNVPMARKADRILGPLFRLVPTVCVYQALFAIALVANLQMLMPKGAAEAMLSMLGENGPKISTSPFAYDWAGEPIAYLAFEAVAFFLVAVVVDICMHSPRLSKFLDSEVWARHFLSRLRSRGGSDGGDAARLSPLIDGATAASTEGQDSSVELERERTALVSPSDIALHVWQLEKTYRRWLSPWAKPKHAVRGVSFSVHGGEVFGLLGHNGAGKTSALKCLVGEANSTAGEVHVGGFHMERKTGVARRKIGYCPQFDALMELLSVRDHLDLIAPLKGLPRSAVDEALQSFKLEGMASRRADLLSGGNRRKLSAAIALIGSPALAVLDEPSCGLDPAARRALWGAVHSAVAGATVLPGSGGRCVGGSAVLLTTHSMEEAEALSTRLGIMAEGRLLTVGTSQQIKQRHGACHELCLTLRPEAAETLAQSLQQLGGGTPLRPETPLALQSVSPLVEADAAKKRAYARARCIVRAQIEAVGFVEASVLAEWWLQQTRGEAIEAFLRRLVGDGVDLAENFGPYWRFRLPHGGCGLPDLFRHLEETGKALGIAEYTLTQATLEQIFNAIAGEAEEERQRGTEA